MVRVLGVVLLLATTAPGSCSGKTESGDDDTKPSPVAQCQTYASTWCNKAFGCYVEVGRLDEGSRQTNVDQCVQLITDKLPCSGVTSVSSDYDTCISQIKGMACSKWNVPSTQFGTITPPASCDNALSFE